MRRVFLILIICLTAFTNGRSQVNIPEIKKKLSAATHHDTIFYLNDKLIFAYAHMAEVFSNDSAIYFCEQNLKILEEYPNDRFKTIIILNLSIFYYYRGEYLKSLKLLEEGLVLAEQTKDYENMGAIYVNMGDFYINIHEDSLAITKLYLALEMVEITDVYDETVIRTCLNLGKAYFRLGRMDSSEYYIKKSMKYAEDLNDYDDYLYNLITYYELFPQLTTVDEKIFGVESYVELHKDKIEFDTWVKVNKVLSISYLEKGNLQKAKFYIEAYEAYVKKLNVDYNRAEFLQVKIDYYEKIGDYKSALKYAGLLHDIKNKLINREVVDGYNKIAILNEQQKSQAMAHLLKNEVELTALHNKSLRNQSLLMVLLLVLTAYSVVLLRKSKRSKEAFNRDLLEKNNELSGIKGNLDKLNSQLVSETDVINLHNDELKGLIHNKNRFISIISHDLKAPLTSVNGFSEILLEDEDELNDSERWHFVEIIQKSVKNMSLLINDVTDWFNLSEGNKTEEMKPVNMTEVIDSVFDICHGVANIKQIKLVNRVKKNTYVYSQYYVVLTILRNLITNAIKFSHPKSAVTIKAESVGRKIRIIVEDKGVGISPDNIVKLKDRSEHFTTKGTDNEHGTGIGLNLCFELGEKIGEEVDFTSVKGQGTTFWFTLQHYMPEI
jgi:signal transduction histidine kinase